MNESTEIIYWLSKLNKSITFGTFSELFVLILHY